MKLLRGLTKIHIHGVSPPVTADNLNSLFSALPALQVPCIKTIMQSRGLSASSSLPASANPCHGVMSWHSRLCGTVLGYQACSLGLTARPNYRAPIDSKGGIPTAMYGCTQLTSLAVYDVPQLQACLDWVSSQEGSRTCACLINTSVMYCHQRDRSPKPRVCSKPSGGVDAGWTVGRHYSTAEAGTAPLAGCSHSTAHRRSLSTDQTDVSRSVQQGLHCVRGAVRPSLLLDAAASLTGLRQLDIDGMSLPPALEALTGLHLLTTLTLTVC